MSGVDLPSSTPALPNSELIYHYTTQEGLRGIIQSRSLWATHVRFLNDESEWQFGSDLYSRCVTNLSNDESAMRSLLPSVFDNVPSSEHSDLLRDLQQDLSDIAEPLQKVDAFTISFSVPKVALAGMVAKSEDDLSQWMAYAGGSGGFAIQFDKNHLTQQAMAYAAKNQISLIASPCIYDAQHLSENLLAIVRKFLTIAERRNSVISHGEVDNSYEADKRGALKDLVIPLAQAKHEAFRGENEWRLTVLPRKLNPVVKFRTGRSSLIPYIELKLAPENEVISSIRKIMVGPSIRQEDSVAALKMFLRAQGYKLQGNGEEDGIVIERSLIPYRNW